MSFDEDTPSEKFQKLKDDWNKLTKEFEEYEVSDSASIIS